LPLEKSMFSTIYRNRENATPCRLRCSDELRFRCLEISSNMKIGKTALNVPYQKLERIAGGVVSKIRMPGRRSWPARKRADAWRVLQEHILFDISRNDRRGNGPLRPGGSRSCFLSSRISISMGPRAQKVCGIRRTAWLPNVNMPPPVDGDAFSRPPHRRKFPIVRKDICFCKSLRLREL
jgi:hypothetical protein